MREARIDETEQGHLPVGEGWFILNLGEMPWGTVPGFGVWRDLDWARASGDEPGVGVHIHVLQPGETNGYYHAEAAPEGFVVLSGECLAVVEGQERPMRQWDFLHSPPGTAHATIGAGEQASSARPGTPKRRTAIYQRKSSRPLRRPSGDRPAPSERRVGRALRARLDPTGGPKAMSAVQVAKQAFES